MNAPQRRPTAVVLSFQRARHTQNTVLVALLDDDEVAQVGDLLEEEGFGDGPHVFGRTSPVEGVDAVRSLVVEAIRQAARQGLAPNGAAARAMLIRVH